MPLVILHNLLNVSVQLANKRGLKKKFIEEIKELELYEVFLTSVGVGLGSQGQWICVFICRRSTGHVLDLVSA
jgi:hypothetical protein